jgi:Ca2+-binding RTX toxin-like protein
MTSRHARLRQALLASGAVLGTAYASAVFATPAGAATTVTLTNGALTVVGDEASNALVVGRTTDGILTVNGVPALGGTAQVARTTVIRMEGGGGNDTLTIDERGGAMPRAEMVGGTGNDRLTGGSAADSLLGGDGVDSIAGNGGVDTLVGDGGNDKVVGGRGDDFVLLGADADEFTWNPGDGSDHVDGDDGTDTLRFNGSNANELLEVSSAGTRTSLFRNIANVRMSLGGFERLTITTSAGADLVQVGDLSGTGTTVVQVAQGPDPDFDVVAVTGTSGNDRIRVGGPSAAGITVSGLATTVQATGAESLDVRGLGGNDVIDAGRLTGGSIRLTESGNNGDDTLVGTPGNDILLGGDGNDRLEGRGGVDVLDGGPGDNVIIR